MTHICVGNLTIIGPDNGLSPGRCQAIIWTNARILSIGPWGTNFSEILIDIQTVSFKKMHVKMSSAKWRSFCLGLNVLHNKTRSMDLIAATTFSCQRSGEREPRTPWPKYSSCQTSNIRWTLAGNIIVDHSAVVGASPIGAAPTTASFST